MGRRRLRTLRAVLAVLTVVGAAGAAPAVAADACPEPPLYDQQTGDNSSDAAGRGQLFERIQVPGITDRNAPTQSVAFVDLNRDGPIDVVVAHKSNGLTVFLNEGCFDFRQHPIHIERRPEDGDNWGFVTLSTADFNNDGFADFYVGNNGAGQRSQLLVSNGSFDTFRDVAVPMGVANEDGYVHGQVSLGDVNGDGWLDIAVGAEQIAGDTDLGRPLSRLYVYEPPEDGGAFANGRFVDIGGTSLIPDFGGVSKETCNPDKDRAVSSILLRDLDDDGDLDLVHGSQLDMNPGRPVLPDDPCATGSWRFGIFAWENLFSETGHLGFRKIAPGEGGDADTDAVLAEEGRLRYDHIRQQYEPVKRAMSSYVLGAADFENDGDLDLATAVSTDPEWNAQSEWTGGKSWRNDGRWRFTAATPEQGLGALGWTYRQWAELWDTAMRPSVMAAAYCGISPQRGRCATMALEDHTFMSAGLVFADFDNDRWQDLIYLDRHEVDNNYGFMRDVLLMNDRGVFTPTTTEFSGISENMIGGEGVDLNGDGLLEFYEIARNTGSGQPPRQAQPAVAREMPADSDMDRIYWNTGLHGGRENHWLRVRLAGLPEGRLIGSRVYAYDPATGELIGRRDYTTVESYKTTHEAWAQFGLGDVGAVDVEVVLPGGETRRFADVPVDGAQVLDVSQGSTGRDKERGRGCPDRAGRSGRQPSCRKGQQ